MYLVLQPGYVADRLQIDEHSKVITKDVSCSVSVLQPECCKTSHLRTPSLTTIKMKRRSSELLLTIVAGILCWLCRCRLRSTSPVIAVVLVVIATKWGTSGAAFWHRRPIVFSMRHHSNTFCVSSIVFENIIARCHFSHR